MYSSVVGAVKRYLDKVVSLVQQTLGPAHYGLYITNNQGKFELSPEPLVASEVLVDNDEDLGYIKGTLQSNEYIFNTWKRISRKDTLSDNANPEESDAFVYNEADGTIQNPLNTGTLVGFVSPDSYDNYVFETVLTSTSQEENDPIGVLIGYMRDGNGDTHTLTVLRGHYRRAGGPEFAMEVAVDTYTQHRVVVAGVNEGLQWIDGRPATDPSPVESELGGIKPWRYDPWGNQPAGISIRVTRTGDHFKVETTLYGSTEYVPEATVEFDLDDLAATRLFKGPSPYGYVSLSQEYAIWTSTQRPGNTPTAIDVRTGDKHEWDGSDWVVVSADLEDTVKRGRLYYNKHNGKAFYCDSRGWVQQISET